MVFLGMETLSLILHWSGNSKRLLKKQGIQRHMASENKKELIWEGIGLKGAIVSLLLLFQLCVNYILNCYIFQLNFKLSDFKLILVFSLNIAIC